MPETLGTETWQLDSQRIAQMFGLQRSQLPASALAKIAQSDFRHRALSGEEREAVIKRIQARIAAAPTPVLDQSRRDLWARVWEGQRTKATAGNFDAATLEPDFVAGEPIIRLDGDFRIPLSARMELDFYAVVRRILFDCWIGQRQSAFEFGCGSAFNLLDLAELYPHLSLVGLDWAPASVALVDDIARRKALRMEGRLFDFFAPDETLNFLQHAAVFTFCALEQTGERHERFTDFLVRSRPGICIHLEPILEFYDPRRPIDQLAIAFHNARKYLTGFLTNLHAFERSGRIKILDQRRLGFGSVFHEAYSVVVWQPA